MHEKMNMLQGRGIGGPALARINAACNHMDVAEDAAKRAQVELQAVGKELEGAYALVKLSSRQVNPTMVKILGFHTELLTTWQVKAYMSVSVQLLGDHQNKRGGGRRVLPFSAIVEVWP